MHCHLWDAHNLWFADNPLSQNEYTKNKRLGIFMIMGENSLCPRRAGKRFFHNLRWCEVYCEGLFNRAYCVMCERPALQCPLIETITTSISVRMDSSGSKLYNGLENERLRANKERRRSEWLFHLIHLNYFDPKKVRAFRRNWQDKCSCRIILIKSICIPYAFEMSF